MTINGWSSLGHSNRTIHEHFEHQYITHVTIHTTTKLYTRHVNGDYLFSHEIKVKLSGSSIFITRSTQI